MKTDIIEADVLGIGGKRGRQKKIHGRRVQRNWQEGRVCHHSFYDK